MAGKLKESVINDVRALIKNLTGFEDEDENFRACERFSFSNLIHHRYLSVDSHAIRRSIDGITEKFNIHGTFDKAREFDSLIQAFFANEDYKDHETIDLQWALLSFLLHTAQNPTGADIKEDESNTPIIVPVVHDDHSGIDWPAYLREGEEEFHKNWNEASDSEDEVDLCMTPSAMTQILPRTTPPCCTPTYTPPASPFTQHRGESPSQIYQTDNKHLRAQIVQRAVASGKWLEHNVQNTWWSNRQYKQEVSSKHPSSSFICLEKDKEKNIALLSEHKVVLEVLWLLTVPSPSGTFTESISDDGKEWKICVRPHVSIPSITEDIFVDMLSLVSSHACMVKDLHTFCTEVFKDKQNRSASHTYKAYANALQEELLPLQEMISTLEVSAHKQEKSHTLLETIESLTPCLQKLNVMYSLHQHAVLDWRNTPNWLCATHLLSVLLGALLSLKEDSIAFIMFTKTFSAYIGIAEQWLTKGQLFDWENEFLITRCKGYHEQGILGAVVVEREWEKELRERKVEPPAVLQILANCLLQAARPLHVLHQLERLAGLHGHISSKSNLYQKFLENLVKHLEGFQSSNDINQQQAEENKEEEMVSSSSELWWKELDSCLQLKPAKVQSGAEKEYSSMEKSFSPCLEGSDILTYSQRLEDPFLEEAFQDLLVLGQSGSSKVLESHTPQEKWEKEMYQRLINCHSLTVGLPLNSILERAVYQLSSDWEVVAGSMVANILVRERRLLHHLHVVQSVFFLQAMYKLQPFLSHLFRMMMLKGDAAWADPHSLSVLLQDCMDADQFSVSVNITDKDPADMSVLEAIDSLHIHYESEWPVSAIIGERCQIAYNKIFHLLIKLRWGVWMLEGLNFTDIVPQMDHPLVQRLLYLRFWLLHVVRGAYGFVAGHILNALCLRFEQDIGRAQDLHAIVQVHEKFLETSLQQSLQAEKQEVVKSALFQLLVLADKLKHMWHADPKKIRDDTLSNIEECFSKCHVFLATVLRTLAGESGQHHLEYLSDIFNCSTPSQQE